MRFGDRLRYRSIVPDDAGPKLVPRLALQTLVENSVKYAVSPRREGATIVVRAHEADGRVRDLGRRRWPGLRRRELRRRATASTSWRGAWR